MSRTSRRARGLLLRFIRNRPLAIIVGALLAAPALWMTLGDHRWAAWYTDAFALLLGATGAALLLAGLSGRRGDWVDPENRG